MPTEFTLPELGENVTDGDVLRVLVKAGDVIARDQPVIELETEKATVEVPSTVAGRVEAIQVKEGDRITVGQVVLTVETDGAAAEGPADADGREPAAAAQPEAAGGRRGKGAGADRRARAAEAPAAAAKTEQPAETPSAEPPADAAPSEPGGVAELTIPELGENITSGDVLRLLVKPGDVITRDQPVVELETEKATVEVPSTIGGRVSEIRVEAGQAVQVGQVILTVETSASEGAAAPSKPAPAAEAPERSETAAPAPAGAERPRAEVVDISRMVRPPAEPAEVIPARPNVPAAPSVRRLARELGLDVQDVPGSGPAGRISQADVLAYGKQVITAKAAPKAAPGAAATPALPDFSRWGEIERKTLSGVRRKTAENLARAWSLIPSVTQGEQVDVTALEELRRRFGPQVEKAGGKLTVTAVLAKILGAAVRAFPHFNTSLDLAREELIYKKYVHVGIAVDTDRGLLVPVIRDVDTKSITQIAVEITQAAERARDRKTTLDEMSGGSITITNLGGLGGTHFSPIVNWPEVAILGVSRARMEPVWIDGAFQPRLMLPLSLSYDHRVIDGADAMRFLRWVADALEQPFLLALHA